MSRSRIVGLGLIILVSGAIVPPSRAGLVSMVNDPNTQFITAGAGNYTQDGHGMPGASRVDFLNIMVIDGVDHTLPVSAAGSTSTATANYAQTDANTVVFRRDYESERAAGAPYGNIARGGGAVRFTADDENLRYTIKARFTNSNGYTWMGGSLVDETVGPTAWLYDFRFEEFNVGKGADYVVDPLNPPVFHTGYLSGTLIRGHSYVFNDDAGTNYFQYSGDNPVGNAEGGQASGYFELTISRVQSVPEPSATLLAVSAALGLFSVKAVKGTRMIVRKRIRG